MFCRFVMTLINRATSLSERMVTDHATGRLKSLHTVRRDAARPDVGVMNMTTSSVLQLSSGDQVAVVIDARVAAPMAPRTAEPAVLRDSYRVSVSVPTVSNPPVRAPFANQRFVALEAALAEWTSGWSLRPGLTVGMWLSPNMGWVRD